MLDFLSNLFNTDGFPPRWHCGIWTSGEGWLHILSDIAVFGAYMAIPCVLVFFVVRKRDVPFPRIFWLFALFICACGFGHLLEAIIFWHPIYRFAGLVKLTTAIVSWATVVALVPIMPKALHLPGTGEAELPSFAAKSTSAEKSKRRFVKAKEKWPVCSPASAKHAARPSGRTDSKTSFSQPFRTNCERLSTRSWVTPNSCFARNTTARNMKV